MFIIEEILNSLHGFITNIIDEILELVMIGWRELSGVSIDGSYEGSGGLGEVRIELFEVLVHLGD